jgi:hypothetical protein
MAGVRYVPRGHIGSEQALVLIAKAGHPDRWRDDMLSPIEKEIYERLGRTLNAELLADHLRVILPKAERDRPAVVERLCDFEDAARWLRESLHSGEICSRYLDESGKWHDIPAERWGADDGLGALLKGLIWLDEGRTEVSRLILLAVKKLEHLCRVANSTKAATTRAPQSSISDAKAEHVFKTWRAKRGEDIPTETEDYLFMREFGVSRDRVRRLRAQTRNRERGVTRKARKHPRT